jgi:hypothetical protein
MESCARVIDLFPDYAEGELPPLEAGRVANHLQECSPCCLRVERHREILSALDRLPQVIPPDHFRRALMALVAASPLPPPVARRSHLRLVKVVAWIGLAGAASAAGTTGAWLLGRSFAARPGLLEPSFYLDQIQEVGKLAYSLLLAIATRAELPGLFLAPHNLFAWGGVLTTLLLSGLAAAAVGVGVLATARVLLGHRGR